MALFNSTELAELTLPPCNPPGSDPPHEDKALTPWPQTQFGRAGSRPARSATTFATRGGTVAWPGLRT